MLVLLSDSHLFLTNVFCLILTIFVSGFRSFWKEMDLVYKYFSVHIHSKSALTKNDWNETWKFLNQNCSSTFFTQIFINVDEL